MEITTYAPVVIPTLNRYEHFVRCLESLEKCTGAEYTDVYVALDFPPSEKYKDGWSRINNYLLDKEKSNGFNKLLVTRRERNYGICHENGNFETMVREIKKAYDCYILTEDDNEFSPCFLDFMNKALAKYKDNSQVYLVSGFNQSQYAVDDRQSIFVYDCSAWGMGVWFNKEVPDEKYLKRVLHSPRNVIKLWKAYPILLQLAISIERHGLKYSDARNTVKCICEEKFQVRPSLSLVRNWGNDGSGQHSGKSDYFQSQLISSESVFEFEEDNKVERTMILDRRIHDNMLPKSIYGKIKTHLRIIASLCLYYIENH